MCCWQEGEEEENTHSRHMHETVYTHEAADERIGGECVQIGKEVRGMYCVVCWCGFIEHLCLSVLSLHSLNTINASEKSR